MKREDLKTLGLTDEQIDKIMADNGKDIEKHKTAADTAKSELDSVKSQLVEANKTIEGFKGQDIEGVKKSADEYKAKFEQAEKDAQAQIAQLKFDHTLDGLLTAAKAKNLKAVKALLDTELLKKGYNDTDGSIAGWDDHLKKVKEANDFLFEPEQPAPQVILGGGNKQILSDPVIEAARKAAGLPLPK
jgi:predicted  nucleic acid-binding Zn-ribbon protein